MEDIWRAFLREDIGLPMLLSLITGLVIGLERELRAKPAGLRTHALVCFASTILMLAASRQADWIVQYLPEGQVVTDPTRMAHGILTGIGFLCAGVIFREGVSIHGLTTAASLWTTAAVGTLYGIGMYWLAISGTIATLLVLGLLRLLTRLMPQPLEMRLKLVAQEGEFDAVALRGLLSRLDIKAETISRSLNRAHELELATRMHLGGEGATDALASALEETQGVVSFSIVPAEDDPSFYRPAER